MIRRAQLYQLRNIGVLLMLRTVIGGIVGLLENGDGNE
jgi:hypothetical protein